MSVSKSQVLYAFMPLKAVPTCSIIQWCMLPVLLYGVENWVMSKESLRVLERFQGEMAKRLLRLPKWFSNTEALGWNSMHAICTIRKLRFLYRVTTNVDSICYRTFSALTDRVEDLSLVRECHDLEIGYQSDFVSMDAGDPDVNKCAVKDAEQAILELDRAPKATKYCYLHLVADRVGWKNWDCVLDYGPDTIKSVKHFLRIIPYPHYASHKFPLCEVLELESPLPAHILNNHVKSRGTWDELMDSLLNLDPSFFSHVLVFLHVF